LNIVSLALSLAAIIISALAYRLAKRRDAESPAALPVSDEELYVLLAILEAPPLRSVYVEVGSTSTPAVEIRGERARIDDLNPALRGVLERLRARQLTKSSWSAGRDIELTDRGLAVAQRNRKKAPEFDIKFER
jgi:hypothetical protein